LSEDGEESDDLNAAMFNKPATELLEDGEGGEPAMDVESDGPLSPSSQYDEQVHQSMGIDLMEPLPDSSDEEEEDAAVVGNLKGPSLDSSDGDGDGQVSQKMAEDTSSPVADVESQEPLPGEDSLPIADVGSIPRRSSWLGDGEGDQEMVDVRSSRQPSDKMDFEKRGKALDMSEDGREDGPLVKGRKADVPTVLESNGDGEGDQEMADVELSKQLSDKLEVDERGEPSDNSEDGKGGKADDVTAVLESNGATLISDTLVQPPTPIEPRRSSRLAPLKKMPIAFPVKTYKVTAGKKKSAVKKNGIFPLVRVQIY